MEGFFSEICEPSEQNILKLEIGMSLNLKPCQGVLSGGTHFGPMECRQHWRHCGETRAAAFLSQAAARSLCLNYLLKGI